MALRIDSFHSFFFLIIRPLPRSTLFPYTTLFRSIELERRLFLLRELLFALDGDVGLRLLLLEKKRSEEHTSELQSHHDLVCRLLLEKKKNRQVHASAQPAQCRTKDHQHHNSCSPD